jgi:hypothetical protein
MGFASHLGPWLLGTQKNTTGPLTTAGAQAGQQRNMGATSVGQFKNSLAYNDAATTYAFTLPAGAMITSVVLYQTATFTGTSGVITLYANGTAFTASSAITGGAAGLLTFSPSSTTQVGYWNNISSTSSGPATDQAITYTMASSGSLSAGTGTLLVEYLIRNSDGAANPASV